MSLPRLDKKHVSEIDQFLVDFDKKNPKRSASQIREIKKAERVSRLMKDTQTEGAGEHSDLWDKF